MRILAFRTTPAIARASGADYAIAGPIGDAVSTAEPVGNGVALRLGIVDASAPLPDLATLEGDLLLYVREGGRVLGPSIAPLAALAQEARRLRRAFGFAGGIEAPDIPRLLALGPDLLAFDGADAASLADLVAFDGADAASLADLVALARAMPGPGTGPLDRLFLHGLTLELPIGAYRSEEGRTQRVRFSVDAFVRSGAAGDPDTMARIYSYDLLSDAVTIATTRDHTAFVETLGEEIARLVLADRRVEDVRVQVEKLDLGPASVGIEIHRSAVGKR